MQATFACWVSWAQLIVVALTVPWNEQGGPRVRVPEMAPPICMSCTVAESVSGCLLRQAGPVVTVLVRVPLQVPATVAVPGAVDPPAPWPQRAMTSADTVQADRSRIVSDSPRSF